MPQPPSMFVKLLQSGAVEPLALGLVLFAAGIVLIVRPNRRVSTVVAILSLLPAVIGLIIVCTAAVDYTILAQSKTSPRPSEFAEYTVRAFSSSFGGVLGTLLSVPVSLAALLRAGQSRTTGGVTSQHVSTRRLAISLACLLVCVVSLFVAWERHHEHDRNVELAKKTMESVTDSPVMKALNQPAVKLPLVAGIPVVSKYALFVGGLFGIGAVVSLCVRWEEQAAADKPLETTQE